VVYKNTNSWKPNRKQTFCLIYRTCQFLWYKYFYHDQFQSLNTVSLNRGWRRTVYCQLTWKLSTSSYNSYHLKLGPYCHCARK
jgi:hypothetical protein